MLNVRALGDVFFKEMLGDFVECAWSGYPSYQRVECYMTSPLN